MKAWRVAMWLVGASFTATLPAQAATRDDVAQRSGAERRRAAERDFIARVHYNNQQEILLGQLAAARGETKAIRSLGAQMVRDYQRLDTELARIAERRGVSLQAPNRPLAREMDRERARLPELTGRDFEQRFLTVTVQDSRAIRDNALQDVRPAQLTQLQIEMLKANNAHLEAAQRLLERRFGRVPPVPSLAQENG